MEPDATRGSRQPSHRCVPGTGFGRYRFFFPSRIPFLPPHDSARPDNAPSLLLPCWSNDHRGKSNEVDTYRGDRCVYRHRAFAPNGRPSALAAPSCDPAHAVGLYLARRARSKRLGPCAARSPRGLGPCAARSPRQTLFPAPTGICSETPLWARPCFARPFLSSEGFRRISAHGMDAATL